MKVDISPHHVTVTITMLRIITKSINHNNHIFATHQFLFVMDDLVCYIIPLVRDYHYQHSKSAVHYVLYLSRVLSSWGLTFIVIYLKDIIDSIITTIII